MASVQQGSNRLFPVKALLAARQGTWAVFRFRVTLPPVPPPVRAVPAVTPVIVPVPTAEHAHALPFHCSTCPLAQVVSSPRFSVPLVPPPLRPLPLAVVTPVSVPPPANTMSNSGAWLVDVLSLLSNVALNGLLPTNAIPSLGVPLSQACTASVTSMRMNWFLSAATSGTRVAMVVPSAGARFGVIVLSVQVPVT